MPASIQQESGNLFRIDISGVLHQDALKEVQAVAAQKIASLGTIRLLVVLAEFEGWERSADWGDLAFYAAHNKDIEAIAIICQEKWRDHGLALAGSGVFKAPVRFFPPAELARARAWLLAGDPQR